jgi:hypothetical protein
MLWRGGRLADAAGSQRLMRDGGLVPAGGQA